MEKNDLYPKKQTTKFKIYLYFYEYFTRFCVKYSGNINQGKRG